MIKYQAKNIKKYHRINIVAGKCNDKIISPLVYEKVMDSEFFEKWFKEMFLEEVKENKVIIMDNAKFHRKSRLYDLCKNANKNLRLIFLPPYSPQLNPIEKYWAILKRKLKKSSTYSSYALSIAFLISNIERMYIYEFRYTNSYSFCRLSYNP